MNDETLSIWAFALGGIAIGGIAPTTDLIMTSVTDGRSGAGSARADTAIQLGGSLGIAVMGAVMLTTYRAQLQGNLTEYPSFAARAAQDSIAGAASAAKALGSRGPQLLGQASEAFVHGTQTAYLVAALVAIMGAGLAAFLLPGRRSRKTEQAASTDKSSPLPETGMSTADK
ncbi:hypothetical protein [Leifsonia sp. AG29]|uniref:hypothetical protein n=1 Tax=Leifsonia sp. AG29 TaxID=2598860 RepID=UPI00131CD6F1|nr:hypothetical protein [Leifsonia sp. AG29]